jgi:hypothetical protein
MKMRRLTVPVSEAQAGMCLAADVRNPVGGAVLLAAGTELNEATLAGLRRRGIETVTLDVCDTRTDEEIARQINEAEARISHLFHRHRDNPGLQDLMQCVLDYRRRTLA